MSDAASQDPPIPLQDRTNAPVPTAAELEAAAELASKDQEIAHLQNLVNGFTNKKRRGRPKSSKKRARCVWSCYDQRFSWRLLSHFPSENTSGDEEGAPAKKAKDDDPQTDYIVYGRIIARFLGPFVNISHVIEYGCTLDAAMSGDEGEVE